MADRVLIFDTTLRDGEQSPGASMNADEKMQIARALERLRVDVIEAGFPSASKGDFASVKAIADEIRDSQICGLARAREADIDGAGEALAGASDPRIHTFIATSDIHLRAKLKMSRDEVQDIAVAAVKRARRYTDNVEFSAEDAGRTDSDFLCRMVEAAIDAGATTINIPDTVGYAIPQEFGDRIRMLRERVPNSDRATFSVHCHNDLGLAVSNSLAAVENGARQVECTVNGLGERAGNAAMEEVVMALRTRADHFGVDTRIETTEIVPTSRLVATVSGFAVQNNKAIVGANAFAHESGIHQDGVLKERETYEIMTAESVGWSRNRMVLGKLSGRNAFRTRLQELGVHLDEQQFEATFERFKALADRKREIFDEDLLALVNDEVTRIAERYKVARLHVCSDTGQAPEADLTLEVDGAERSATAGGDGPVDAAFKAVEAITEVDAELKLYSVNAITGGTDAQGEVTVRLERGGRIVNGQGADTDIVTASVKAYVHALNKLMGEPPAKHPQL
ncbi:2-isopropylmalate synthase [Thiohalorhabdus denitrificans]|uniref:2-isopropylmalate synthase n=1 Tax=Thiohalorhabdus denitrificans TaxID=381306 RepID=A0A0N8PN36_9GAMM|nr:2-isopropylmalate synthase [Thiohalorhabdus denitrificans]KPV40429.1 2-isopropylmalate synthase [Thiohalorhabdus denitrificans]SCY60568.1 2-isopropylmalate synthase [Thiohalorhabdus denitrificans]